MRKLPVVLLLSLAAFPLAAQSLDRAAPQRAARIELIAQYDALAALPMVDRMRDLRALPPDVQQALWTKHVQVFLHDHPNLTAEQRSVAMEGIGLLETRVIEASCSADPEQSAAAQSALRQLNQHATLLLGTELTKAAFYRFGPPELPSPQNRFASVTVGFDLPSCDCATDGDCSDPLLHCISRPHDCVAVANSCGPFSDIACVALCH
ncbi:MAG: hypothetical protein JWO97_4687 [Acidobacteria bacterium]|nr:hypothetical protein [Acidobacteriota bacterium]